MRFPKRTALAIILVSAVLAMVGVATSFAPPAWWTQRQVIATGATPDNYAPANLGQAKWMATKALEEMNAKLASVGGAGFSIDNLFPAPPPAPGQPGHNATTWQAYVDSNYAPLNIGQLKNLSYRFYQRLKDIGYTAAPVNPSNPYGYPWTASTADDDNYAPANLGQLKNVFSFDLDSGFLDLDSNTNEIPDWWEHFYFPGQTNIDPNALAGRGDGLTIKDAYNQGLNPNDVYNGKTPVLAKLSGDVQTGPPDGFVPAPLVVQVSDSNGQPIINGPVSFTVSQGGGQVQKSSIGAPGASITVRTDSSGQAKAFFKFSPNSAGTTSQITATAGNGNNSTEATFSESCDGGGGTYASPFDPSDISAVLNDDQSIDITWTNNRDPEDTATIPIKYKSRYGQWITVIELPAGTTSYRLPKQ